VSDVVSCLHPVPIAYVPRRARLDRLALVETSTSIALTRIDPAEVGGRIGVRHGRAEIPFHRIDGRLFLRVDEPGTDRDTPSLLRDFARSGSTQRKTLLDLAIAGTPLSAQLGKHDGRGEVAGLGGCDVRGVRPEFLGAHVVRTDPTERCRAGLRAWADANVRLAGDGLYVDTGGPLYRPSRPGAHVEFDATPFPRHHADRVRCIRGPFTYAEALEYRARCVEGPGYDPEGPRTKGEEYYEIAAEPLPGRPEEPGAGERMFLNAIPAFLLDCVAPVMRTADGRDISHLDGVSIHAIAMEAAIGMIGQGGLAGIARKLDVVARSCVGIPAIGRLHGERLNLIRAHISDWILPRERERADRLVASDAEALGALVP
jgi:hypothetical protein